jgi:hypothetical protein
MGYLGHFLCNISALTSCSFLFLRPVSHIMLVDCLLSAPSSASRFCVLISREFILTIGKNSPLSSLCEVWCELVDTLGIAKSGSHSSSQWDVIKVIV